MKTRDMVMAMALLMACNGMGAEDPAKVVDIGGVHYTGVAWGPIKDGKAMMISDEGVLWIKLEDLPERVARSYGLRGGNVNSGAPIKGGVPVVPSVPASTAPSIPVSPAPSADAGIATAPSAPAATKLQLLAESGWKVIRRWTSAGTKDTEPFSIASPMWRIRWTTAPQLPSGSGVFYVRVCRPGDKTAVAQADGVPSGVTYCYVSGEFYLGIMASSGYEVVAEEKSANVTAPTIPGATPARGAPTK